MSKPATLRYPPELIAVTTNRLKRGLRRIHRLVKRGVVMAPNDALLRGEEVIDKEFEAYIARINGYLDRHNLDPITGEEPDIQTLFTETKEMWGRIVNDMFGA